MNRICNALLLALLMLSIAACEDDPAAIGNGVTGSRVMQADYVVVGVRPVANEINVTGTLMADESALLSAQTAGLIREIFFREGDQVRQGQLLVKLDDRQWQAQREKLGAQLEQAQRDLARKQELLQIQGVSQAEVDDAELLLASIEADIQELEVMIDYASIKAPFSGRVGLRDVSPGSYLAAGTPVVRLVKVNPLKLEFSVPEAYANQVKAGQSLRFSVNGSDSLYLATVYATEASITETSRALSIRARVPNPSGHLIAGAFAEVTLTLDSIPDALLIPTEAVVPQLNEQVVYTIQGGKIQEKQVETGIRLPRLVQISQGLSVGDTVMVSGLLQAKVGAPVAPGEQVTVARLEQ